METHRAARDRCCNKKSLAHVRRALPSFPRTHIWTSNAVCCCAFAVGSFSLTIAVDAHKERERICPDVRVNTHFFAPKMQPVMGKQGFEPWTLRV
jgi:hypothetical protein